MEKFIIKNHKGFYRCMSAEDDSIPFYVQDINDAFLFDSYGQAETFNLSENIKAEILKVRRTTEVIK